MSAPSIRPARRDDLADIERLISSAQLPGFETERFIDTFWVAVREGEVVGCCGLEVYEDAGLLRSAVVAEELRGSGLGAELTHTVIDGARERGVRDLYLFTLDAAPFFEQMGFEKCAMEDFSEAGRRSTQWSAVNERPEIARWLTTMRMELR